MVCLDRVDKRMKAKLVKFNAFLLLMMLIVAPGCTTIPVDERAAVRAEVDQVANETIEYLVGLDPSLRIERGF